MGLGLFADAWAQAGLLLFTQKISSYDVCVLVCVDQRTILDVGRQTPPCLRYTL